VYDSPGGVDEHTFDTLQHHAKQNPHGHGILSTGGTQEEPYRLAVQAVKRGDLDLSHMSFSNQDEYRPLPQGHASSYHTFMMDNLFGHVPYGIGKFQLVTLILHLTSMLKLHDSDTNSIENRLVLQSLVMDH
jgi:6-phosphogluconolactonase/glucosamine-6-phosphate isomerase/deaminase